MSCKVCQRPYATHAERASSDGITFIQYCDDCGAFAIHPGIVDIINLMVSQPKYTRDQVARHLRKIIKPDNERGLRARITKIHLLDFLEGQCIAFLGGRLDDVCLPETYRPR